MNIRNKLSTSTLFITLYLLVASNTVFAAQPDASSINAFTLGPGDNLEVNVWLNKELSRNLTISPDGTINYLLVGLIQAAGLTVEELQEDIQTRLKQHVRAPQVTVTLIEAKSYRIYVMGEVSRPGVFDVQGPVTVIQALAMAGGFTPFASRNKIAVVNSVGDPGSRVKFEYDDFVEAQTQAKDIILRPGDTVLVP